MISCQNLPRDHRREKCSFKTETCRFPVNCLEKTIHRIALHTSANILLYFIFVNTVIISLKLHIMEEDIQTLTVNLSLGSEDIEAKMKTFMTYKMGKLAILTWHWQGNILGRDHLTWLFRTCGPLISIKNQKVQESIPLGCAPAWIPCVIQV